MGPPGTEEHSPVRRPGYAGGVESARPRRPEDPSEPREAPAEPAPAGEQVVRVAGSPVRCPFCHEDVRREAPEAWVACAGCMARHHAACWDEAGRCSACGAGERLAPERAARQALRRVPGASREQAPWSGLLGAPRRVLLEETFEGEASLADAPWFEREMRRALGGGRVRQGQLELQHQAIVWRFTQCRAVTARLSWGEGRTRLTLEEDLGQLAGGLYGGVLGGAGLGGSTGVVALLQGLGAGGWLQAGAAVVWLLALFLLVRLLLTRFGGDRLPSLGRVRDRLVRGLEAGPPGAAPPPRPRPHLAK